MSAGVQIHFLVNYDFNVLTDGCKKCPIENYIRLKRTSIKLFCLLQAYGGDGIIQRIKRVAFDAKSTIMVSW